MALIDFWTAQPEAVLGMTLPLIVRMAIDPENNLKDGSKGSQDFRQFLNEIRRLPRQVDKLEVEISALPTLGRYTSGGRLPRDS